MRICTGDTAHQAPRTANMVVYAAVQTSNGTMATTPVGRVPRCPLQYERRLKRAYKLGEAGCMVNGELAGQSAVLFWTHGRVDAVCVSSVARAEKLPGYSPFNAADLTA